MNSGFVGFGEERTASFAIDVVPIVTASYGPRAGRDIHPVRNVLACLGYAS